MSALEPRRSPAATAPAVLLGVALCGIAGLCIRELIINQQLIDGEPWLANASVWIAQLQWQDWMMGAAPAATVLGLVLIAAALKPRARTHLPLKSDTGIWLRPTDVARMCSAIAFEEPNVLTAITTVTARRAEVAVTAAHHVGEPLQTSADQDSADQAFEEQSAMLRERLHDRVTALVEELQRPLEVRVTVLPGIAHTPDQRRRVI